jgi:hypothetical protein
MGRPQKALDFYLAARARAGRRRSPWNLILIPFGLGGWLGTWYLLFRLVWNFHHWLYPQHLFSDFWREGIPFASFVPSFLMLFAPAVAALCVGLMIANCIVLLIPPARRALDAEAVGYPGTGFKEATRALFGLLKWALPIGMAVAMFAASVLRSMR